MSKDLPGPSLPLGVEVMDRDHAVLEALLAEAPGVPDEELGAYLVRLDDEVRAHFSREEEVMAAANVPVLFCHIAQHKRILDLITMARGFALKGEHARLRLFVGQMLPAEIEAHVASVDRVSAQFIRGELPEEKTANLRLPACG